MKTKLAKWGNSMAFRVPSKALERLNVTIGSNFSVDVKNNTLVLSPSNTKMQLIPIKQLVKGFNGREKEFQFI